MYGPTNELPAHVIDSIAQVVASELCRVVQAIPVSPAAELGRLAQPQPGRRRGGVGLVPAPAQYVSGSQRGSAAKAGLADVPPLVAERLLGALELTVAALNVPVPQLIEALPEISGRSGSFIIASMGNDSEMSVELSKLDAFVPAATDMVAHVVAVLAEHPSIAPLLVGTGADEAAIAAAHGARRLALAVLVATIVLRPLWPDIAAPAIVGAALGVAALMLRDAPMPTAYAEAVLAKRRAEYLMPRQGWVRAVVTDHVLALAEGPLESILDFSENGLVAVIPNGIAVRSGMESGLVSVMLRVVEEPPEPDVSSWEEVVEVGWHAPAGGAAFSGSGETTQITPPWPGDYRVRVSVSGRDDERDQEQYEFVVWRSSSADPVVLKQSDRLGHVLRGEPEPPRVVAPDEVYRWVESSSLAVAATVTFVADKSGSEVLRAFGADESAPAPLSAFFNRDDYHNIDPWVCVLDVAGGAVAVEFNGFEGSKAPVLRALSSPENSAASMYWNVNAVRRFSLARNGDILDRFELGMEDATSPEALELLADLDVDRHRDAVGLLAATRFTGVSLSAADLARIEAVDIGYPILPLLPEQYAVPRLPDGSWRGPDNGLLGTDTPRLATLPDVELYDLAWWAAAFVCAHSELSEHQAVTASLAARALTPEAQVLARRSELYGQRTHHWLWMTLYAATNPDPLGAAINTLDAARHSPGGRAAELLDLARARLR